MSKYPTTAALEKHLATRSYISGYSLTNDDNKELAALNGIPSAAAFPNVYRWASHIVALTGISCVAATGDAAPAAASTGAKKAAAADDDFDMFGDDDEDEELNDEGETKAEAAATKARQARMAAAAKLKADKDAKDGKVKKEKPAEKSLLVLDVKPWEADTDLETVWKLIKEYKQEGLAWGENFKLEPVAYGIKKLVMTCSIVDSLVLVDDITDAIEALEDHVQSATVASMNKI
eukprot:CAMPEP_0181330296 /NCGR_PEP_ID=MMETSP1101-20121128/23816_1 /TAXON_ID=46948 /ORGANISM="Rhodomonas abbreviata, Strain Caron Lab Isolate" /LENGTH=233 /DNA_ID=CAMNT_0023439527 /DNA_START=33 /DNA_END=734 /DNA_ORIENTATION=+